MAELAKLNWKRLNAAWAIFILFATIVNAQTLEQLRLSELFAYDKPIHMLLFGVQTALILVAYYTPPFSRKALLTAASLAIAYGYITELLQAYLTDSRQFDYFDVLANTVGSIAAATIAAYARPKARRS